MWCLFDGLKRLVAKKLAWFFRTCFPWDSTSWKIHIVFRLEIDLVKLFGGRSRVNDSLMLFLVIFQNEWGCRQSTPECNTEISCITNGSTRYIKDQVVYCLPLGLTFTFTVLCDLSLLYCFQMRRTWLQFLH